MYTRGKIVKVDNYNVNNLDVTNASGALQVKGTVATGPLKEHQVLLIKFI